MFESISLEANIGVGKTTFLENISKYYGDRFNPIKEPLEDWLIKFSDVDNNILGLLYEDSKRWGYTFQHNAFLTRIQKIEKEYDPSKINITERSVLSDYNVFAKMLHDDGKMNDIEWKIYLNWKDLLMTKFAVKPKLIVYLRLDPEIAYERTRNRHRHEEEGIPLRYLRLLHDYHEQWLMTQTEIPVLVLDASVDFRSNPEVFKSCIQQIEDALKK